MTLALPSLWTPPRRIWRPPLLHQMGRLFTASGWLFGSSGGKFAATGRSPTCQFYEALTCADGSHTGVWIRGDRLPASGVAKRDGDSTCYTFDNVCDPCKTDTFGTFTAYADCAACNASSSSPCRCPGAVYTNDSGVTYQQFPGTLANTSYAISGASTLNLAGDPSLDDFHLGAWDGVLVADPYFSPDPLDGFGVNSDSSPRSCQWRDTESHNALIGAPFNADGPGNSTHTISGAFLALHVPSVCDGTPRTFTCDGPSGPIGSVTTSDGSYWQLEIHGWTMSGSSVPVWEGILANSPTPAGTYQFCPHFFAGEINSYAGNLTLS